MIAARFLTYPPDLTTSMTNIFITLGSLLCLVLVLCSKEKRKLRRQLWSGVYISLAAAAFSGVLVHGIAMSKERYENVWIIQSCLLCVAMTAFFVVARYEAFGEKNFLKRFVPLTAVFCGAACAAMLIAKNFWPDYLLIFTAYAGILFAFCLFFFIYKTVKDKKPLYLWSVVGSLLVMYGGLVQAQGKFLVNIGGWDYDFNSLCHITVTLALVFFQLTYALGCDSEEAVQE